MAEQSDEAFDEKSWDPPNLLFIPRSECNNKYYKFISYLCMTEQSKDFWQNIMKLVQLVLFHSLKWMQQHLIYIFMIVILIMDMIIKKISKTHFVTKSGTIMWKREKKNVKILANKMKVYIIITMVKAIWVVLIIHQNILQIMRRT